METLDTALAASPKLEMADVVAYGLESAPLVNYVNVSKKIASEYVIKVGQKKHRVYSWLESTGKDAMYIFKQGRYMFLTEEVAAMLHWGNPQYGSLTPVATSATVIS